MGTNLKKSDQNNQQTQQKSKVSTPRSKKTPKPIQSQKQSLKIGDKITQDGIVQKSQLTKSDSKITNQMNTSEDNIKLNKIDKQCNENQDKKSLGSAQNFQMNQQNTENLGEMNNYNNSIHLNINYFPSCMEEPNFAVHNNSSSSLSNSSGQPKKQRVIIKQSQSNEVNQFQGAPQVNKAENVYKKSEKRIIDLQDNCQNNHINGVDFSFQMNNDNCQGDFQNDCNPSQITPSGLYQNNQNLNQQNNKQQNQQIAWLQQAKKEDILDHQQQNQQYQIILDRKNSKNASKEKENPEIGLKQAHYNNNYGSNGNNNNNNNFNNHGNQLLRQNQNLLQNPLAMQNMQSSPINSLVGSNGERQKLNISLSDQLVVKKSGRYLDDYDNVEQDSNSQNNGKRLIMLGRGGFGQVFLVKQKQGNKEERAMKVIMKSVQESIREVMILKKFSHPNVLKIYEYFEDDQNIYVITERCYGYNLFDYIILRGKFVEQETCKIADGVLRALAEAHKQNIVHRDVKPENIMLDFDETRQKFVVKLIDWGLAEEIKGDYLSKRCGTLHYLAPEVLNKRYNEKVDLWSLGMVLYTLIQGSPPICGKSQMDILEQVQEFRCDFKYRCWIDISDEAKDLILKLLERDFNKRISAAEALKHPWFHKFLGQANINTQDLTISYQSLVKYTEQNAFKKTILGFFASHVVSKRERVKYIEMFQALDTDKNGELSIEELKAGFSKIFDKQELEVCEKNIEDIFQKSLSSMFENAQGIKYEEFISSMLACSATYSQDQLLEAFQVFDKDRNGKISLNEIIQTLGIQEQTELIDCFKKIIEQSDNNQDGEIDFEEFRQIMTNFLDKHSQDLLSQEIYL
ncbi:kinase domain protein (macronuclear) [Tetrahymena thermophila SB210]|uniref:Kinase domain protein n=1 Tax=Tetrahymena thermophila (strain SB210) TaxID=312017 RepID=Q22S00_TETTS|nr:kinase domain protein [Tetrahymena thermophila SB210]EAR87972.1 kinase domain protein [Tetrahymena thermophila SB210]|eukprot:XP_001008217.1 kinase domain protein [Tetrahymena thermophila SB210]